MIVLDPRWLCSTVCGHLLSQDFVQGCKPNGIYTLDDFQLAVPDWNALDIMPVLEALGLCTQVRRSWKFSS